MSNNEWVLHTGSKTIPSGAAYVEIKCRNGDIQRACAREFVWLVSPHADNSADIVAYRIIDGVSENKTAPNYSDTTLTPVNDPVNHPKHYTSDPSGVECITITRHRNFNIGNAIKYLWRAGLKVPGTGEVEDLKKAVWYIQDEIKRLGGTP